MTDEIVLYDVRGKGDPHCFSPNVWAIRASLNYKKLPYKTEWLEFGNIEETLKPLGVRPNPPGFGEFDYSVPTIKFASDGTYVSNSLSIAHAIEERYPEPSLHLDNDYSKQAQDVRFKCLTTIALPYVYRIPDMLLAPKSAAWYHAARKEKIGVSLYDLRDGPDTCAETTWTTAQPALDALKQLLTENDGPYIMGEEVSYADFVILGWWQICYALDQDGDLHGRQMKFHESFERHWQACQKFCERDD